MNNPDPNIIIWIGGAVVILNAATQVAVNIISEVILGKNGKKNNGFCNEHHILKETLDSILENQKEERQEEMLTRVINKTLERNNK